MVRRVRPLLAVLFLASTALAGTNLKQEADLDAARRAYEASDYAKAVQTLQEGAARDPQNGDLHLLLAKNYLELEQLDAAIRSEWLEGSGRYSQFYSWPAPRSRGRISNKKQIWTLHAEPMKRATTQRLFKHCRRGPRGIHRTAICICYWRRTIWNWSNWTRQSRAPRGRWPSIRRVRFITSGWDGRMAKRRITRAPFRRLDGQGRQAGSLRPRYGWMRRISQRARR